MKTPLLGSLLLVSVLVGCNDKGPPPMPPRQNAATPATTGPRAITPPVTDAPAPATQGSGGQAPQQVDDARSFTVSGIAFSVPQGWTPAPVRDGMFAPIADMRFAHAAGEVRAVFFAVEGGGMQANMQRWQRQMSDMVGEAKITSSEIGGLTAHRLEMVGSYAGMSPTGSALPPAPNTKFVGYYIDGAARPVQIRINGPKEAVDACLEGFEAMLQKMKKPS